MNQDALSDLAELLNAGGLNYAVFLRSYRLPFAAGASSEELIRNALGANVVVGGCCEVMPAEMLADVRTSLTFEGDIGAGPDPQVMQSERFAELLDRALAEVSTAVGRAAQIEEFWLKEGHPDYPVYWDFAFLLKGAYEAFILLGSSSD